MVLGTEAMPDDSIGSWSSAALRHLMLVNGLGQDEALGVMAEFYGTIPDKGFSDRLSAGRVKELLRSDACLARKIAEGNLGQGRPEDSTATFAGVRAYCDRIGFDFADRSTWHVLRDRRRFPFDIGGEDFSLTFGEKLAVKIPGAALLKCDTASVYEAAHCVKAFVTKYPGRELPAGMVPRLCEDLPIHWHVPSDGGERCKKAERFLRLLCDLGVIEVLLPREWHGVGHPGNRATTYGLPGDGTPSDLGRRWFSSTWTRHDSHPVAPRPRVVGSIYITDSYSFSEDDFEQFVGEVERLERPWTPRFHSSG